MSTKLEKIENVIVIAGFKSPIDLILKLALPVLGVTMVIAIVFGLISSIPNYFGALVIFLGFLFVVSYPAVRFGVKKKDINTNLHFFITYAGTIATMKISRGMLFRRIAQKKVFGEISNVFEKILYLAKGWNLGFAVSCRTMAKRSSSQIMADFLDRFAVVMDFGQDLEVFLFDEQKAVVDDYAVEYKKSLESIRLLQELFVAFSVSFSFMLGIALFAPLLLDFSVEVILIYALIGLFLVDGALVFAILSFIPSDRLFHNLDYKNRSEKKIMISFYATLVMAIIILVALLTLTDLSFIFAFSLSILPLVVPALLANEEEGVIMRRDRQFPVYLRVLGSAIEVRNGGVISALRSTQIHDFGVLNAMSISLHRRLRLGSDKYKSWYYFAAESGSNLIFNFSKIFSESVYLGGNADKIGQIVSRNVLELISLRKLRQQIAQGLRGAFYGSLIGITSTMYVTAQISQLLTGLFSKPDGIEDEVFSFVNSILPTAGGVNFDHVLILVAVLIIFHSAASVIIMKLIDGGSAYAGLIDFIIMVWIGALLSWFLPNVVGNFLPDFSGVWNSTG